MWEESRVYNLALTLSSWAMMVSSGNKREAKSSTPEDPFLSDVIFSKVPLQLCRQSP